MQVPKVPDYGNRSCCGGFQTELVCCLVGDCVHTLCVRIKVVIVENDERRVVVFRIRYRNAEHKVNFVTGIYLYFRGIDAYLRSGVLHFVPRAFVGTHGIGTVGIRTLTANGTHMLTLVFVACDKSQCQNHYDSQKNSHNKFCLFHKIHSFCRKI